jgi:hypothetical protein
VRPGSRSKVWVSLVPTHTREGWEIDSATSSARRRRGTPNLRGAAPPALHNLGDPSPSPSPVLLWNLVALADFMRLSLLKGARAASSSAVWQEIRVSGWAYVWLPAYGPGSDLRFIAGYHTPSLVPGEPEPHPNADPIN